MPQFYYLEEVLDNILWHYDLLGSHPHQPEQKCNHGQICWPCHKEQMNQLVPLKYSHPPTYK